MGGRLTGLPAVAGYTGPFAKLPFHGKYVPLAGGVIGGVIAIMTVVGIIAAVRACRRCAQQAPGCCSSRLAHVAT